MKFGGVKPSHEYQMGVLSLKQKKIRQPAHFDDFINPHL